MPLPQDFEQESQSEWNPFDLGDLFERERERNLPVQALSRAVCPAQVISGHDSSSLSDPMHSRPLFFGSGLVQVRFLVRTALPHVVGHIVHSLHGDQLP